MRVRQILLYERRVGDVSGEEDAEEAAALSAGSEAGGDRPGARRRIDVADRGGDRLRPRSCPLLAEAVGEAWRNMARTRAAGERAKSSPTATAWQCGAGGRTGAAGW